MLKQGCDQRSETSRPTAKRSQGNTVTEYALIGCLVLLVSITALQLLGSNLNLAMAKIKSDMKAKNHAAMVAESMQQAAAAGKLTGMTTADLAILQESLTSKLQTTGANGSTEILAKQIAAAAELLLKEGKIDQSQYDILMKLSNQGHKMAQIESMISDAMKFANGDVNAFNTMTFNLDGQTYTASELSKLVGFNGPSPADFGTADILSFPTDTSGGAINSFLSLYQEAVASGALSDPLALSTVQSASTQIASLGELTEDVSWNIDNGMAMDAASVTTLTSASSTQMNSSKICQTGQFVDNGTLCSL